MNSRTRPLVAGLAALSVLVLPAGAGNLPLKSEQAPDPLAGARTRGYATLDDCFQAAAGRSERIARAAEDYQQARLVRTTARASVLPQITLEDTYNRQNEVILETTTPGSTTPTFFSPEATRNEALVRLQQPIFQGFRDRSFLAFAGSNIEAFQHRMEDARRLLYGSVAQTFYRALQREGEVKALEDTVQVERERFREIQARREAGLARRTEVLLVESQLAEDEARVTRAQNDLKIARQELAFLMALPLDLPLRDEVAVPDSGEANPRSEASIQEAMKNRSDVKQREKAVEAARYQVSVARGEYYPRIDLEGTAILDRYHFSEFGQKTDWTAEVSFSLPLFDGGRIRANVATAQSQYRQAVLDRDELARQVSLEVESAWLTFQSDLAQVKTLEASVASASENAQLVLEEYRSGLATNLEVITGQNQLLSARLELERQKYQVKLDWVALKLAQGLLP